MRKAFLLFLVLGLPIYLTNIVHGFLNTPIQAGQIIDSFCNNDAVANYGFSTQYGYNAPASDTHPQFYSGLESHGGKNICSDGTGYTYGVYELRITLTGTDPNGVTLSGVRFTSINELHSPETNGASQTVLLAIFNVLANSIPYGIGSAIQYGLCCVGGLTQGSDSSSSWADWGSGNFQYPPQDSGLEMGFQLAVDPTLQGTYIVHVSYLVVTYRYNTAVIQFSSSTTVSETIYYCYLKCSSDFSMAANPSSLNVASGSSGGLSTLALGSLNSFTGSVSLSATASDPSLQWTFSPQMVTIPSGSVAQSTITISTSVAACSPGSYTVTVTANANGITHSFSISVAETCPADFALSFLDIYNNPSSSYGMCQGWGTTTIGHIKFQSYQGFSGWISTSSSSSPNGLYTWLLYSAVQLNAGGSFYDTLSIDSSSAPAGTYAVTVTGSSGSLTRSTSVSVTLYSSTWPSSCSGGSGGGGGSVAYGTPVSMLDGSTVPVQNLHVGDRLLGYNTTANQFTVSTIKAFKQVDTGNMIIIHTTAGTPFRVDANPRQTLWVKTAGGQIGWRSVTQIVSGDSLFTQNGWVPVTSIGFAPSGDHVMFDITATAPYFASGYLDPVYKL